MSTGVCSGIYRGPRSGKPIIRAGVSVGTPVGDGGCHVRGWLRRCPLGESLGSLDGSQIPGTKNSEESAGALLSSECLISASGRNRTRPSPSINGSSRASKHQPTVHNSKASTNIVRLDYTLESGNTPCGTVIMRLTLLRRQHAVWNPIFSDCGDSILLSDWFSAAPMQTSILHCTSPEMKINATKGHQPYITQLLTVSNSFG